MHEGEGPASGLLSTTQGGCWSQTCKQCLTRTRLFLLTFAFCTFINSILRIYLIIYLIIYLKEAMVTASDWKYESGGLVTHRLQVCMLELPAPPPSSKHSTPLTPHNIVLIVE